MQSPGSGRNCGPENARFSLRLGGHEQDRRGSAAVRLVVPAVPIGVVRRELLEAVASADDAAVVVQEEAVESSTVPVDSLTGWT